MSNKIVLVYKSRDSFDKVSNRDINCFSVLPFLLVNTLTELNEENKNYIRFYQNKGPFYINLLKAIDYFIGINVDAINLSLGLTSNVYDPDEPVLISTGIAAEKRIIVVTAAGNNGNPEDPNVSTLQPLALAPWVISVGATNSEHNSLLESSSVGSIDGPFPTFVADGRSKIMKSNSDWKKDPKLARWGPSTSFAAPTVTRCAVTIKKVVEIIGEGYRNYLLSRGYPEKQGLVFLPVIGFADTGVDKKFIQELPQEIQKLIEKNQRCFSPGLTDSEINWIHEVGNELSNNEPPFLFSSRPENILNHLKKVSRPIPGYKKHETGYGFLSEELVAEFIVNLTPQRFVSLYAPKFDSDKYFYLNNKLGCFFSPGRIEELTPYIYSGINQVMYKII